MTPRRRLVDREPAPLGRRLLAFAIDLAVVYVAVVVLLQLVLQPVTDLIGPGWTRVGWFFTAYTFLTMSVPILLYFAGYEASPHQAPPGKQWLGMVVTDAAGERPGFGRVLLRTLVKLLPLELARIALALPGNPFVDPLTSELRMPGADAITPFFLIGSIVALILAGLYLLVAALDDDGRAPHDYLAGTYVLRAEATPSARRTVLADGS